MLKRDTVSGWLYGDIGMLTALSNVLQASDEVLSVRTSQIYKDRDLINGKMRVEAELKAAKKFRNVQREPKAKTTKRGYTYLTEAPDGLHKIGWAISPTEREGEFIVNVSIDMKLIHAMERDDPIALETMLHKLFAAKRVYKGGKRTEFFRLNQDDVAYICSIPQYE
jgi:hypothetical protein